MNHIKLYILLPIILLLNFTPILGANIDNILNTFFYTINDSSYLILHENIFHPTSGSYEQGNMRSQGYSSSRISVYSIENGRLIARKNMGVMDSVEACYILGVSENNLWLYCNKFKSGLQSFFPLTLERKISQAKIYKSLNISVGRLFEPEWHTINEYYGFDAVQQKLIVTNTANKQFYIDVNTFATQLIAHKIDLTQRLNNYIGKSAVFKDSVWQLSGHKQMKFECGSFTASSPNFLYGKFIFEQNKVRLFNHFFTVQEELMAEKEEFERLEDIVSYKKAERLIQNSKQNIKALISGAKPDEVLLQTDTNSFFVLLSSGPLPEAILQIAKLSSQQFGHFNLEWSASIQGMFFNIAQARNTNVFKKYYGSVCPEFNYQFIQAYDNKLIIIYLLQVCCIDVKTGNILWQFKLK